MDNGASQTAAAQQGNQQQAEQYLQAMLSQALGGVSQFMPGGANQAPVFGWGGIAGPSPNNAPGGSLSRALGIFQPQAPAPAPPPTPAPPSPQAAAAAPPQGPPPGPPQGGGSATGKPGGQADASAAGAAGGGMPMWQTWLIQRALSDATKPTFSMHGGGM